MVARLAYSREVAIFRLPINKFLIRDLSPMEYLVKYCKVEERRERLYKLVSFRYQTGRKIRRSKKWPPRKPGTIKQRPLFDRRIFSDKMNNFQMWDYRRTRKRVPPSDSTYRLTGPDIYRAISELWRKHITKAVEYTSKNLKTI